MLAYLGPLRHGILSCRLERMLDADFASGTCVQVSLLGDLSSLCAAFSMIGYLEVGRRLRAWMPIFLYACPVTGALSDPNPCKS